MNGTTNNFVSTTPSSIFHLPHSQPLLSQISLRKASPPSSSTAVILHPNTPSTLHKHISCQPAILTLKKETGGEKDDDSTYSKETENNSHDPLAYTDKTHPVSGSSSTRPLAPALSSNYPAVRRPSTWPSGPPGWRRGRDTCGVPCRSECRNPGGGRCVRCWGQGRIRLHGWLGPVGFLGL